MNLVEFGHRNHFVFAVAHLACHLHLRLQLNQRLQLQWNQVQVVYVCAWRGNVIWILIYKSDLVCFSDLLDNFSAFDSLVSQSK